MQVRFAVTEGMHCASCVRRFEQALEGVPGVSGIEVDLARRQARVQVTAGAPPVAELTRRLHDAGFTVSADAVSVPPPARWPVLTASLLAAATFFLPHHWASIPAAIALVVPGWPVLRSGIRLARPSMDTLIVLGAVTALAIGEAHAAGVTIAFTLIGRFIEAYARAATGAAVARLAERLPPTAVRIAAAGDETIALAAVRVGDRLRLRPGAIVPVDGTLVAGAVSLDEALLTGESLPVERLTGAAIAAGARVVDGTAELIAVGVGADTAIGRLVTLVQAAAVAKPSVQRLVDRIAAVFVPVVVVLAVATGLGWWWLTGTWSAGLLPAAAVLVIACPCALGLATPTALVAAVGTCARAGIYVLTPRALEAAARIDTVAFDKTGTLTTGQFVLERQEGPDSARALQLAAAVEQGSDHPLALAIRCAALERALQPSRGIVQDVRRFTHRVGAGSEAEVDGVGVVVGSAAHLRDHGIAPLPEPAGAASVVQVSAAGIAIGVLVLRDAEREEAAAAVAALPGIGISRVLLVTGDREVAARAAASRLGIDEAIAQCTPQHKLEQLQALQRSGARVAFVGDGINDAPVLAAADLGIAVGTGTEVARAAADAVLAGGDLRGVPRLLGTARRCRRIISENLLLASAYNLVAVPFAACGWIHPGLAAAAMALSSLAVVGNSLRLVRRLP
jgi:Cu+-exporting ATPase